MTIFDATEKVKFLATQSLHYDRYAGCRYFLERVDVNGKCERVCIQEVDHGGTRARVLLEPMYNGKGFTHLRRYYFACGPQRH